MAHMLAGIPIPSTPTVMGMRPMVTITMPTGTTITATASSPIMITRITITVESVGSHQR